MVCRLRSRGSVFCTISAMRARAIRHQHDFVREQDRLVYVVRDPEHGLPDGITFFVDRLQTHQQNAYQHPLLDITSHLQICFYW